MSKMHDVYPLTICNDRYIGTYSGGEWTAWNCDPDDVPVDICLDDVTCCECGNGIWLTEQVPLFGVVLWKK